MIMNNPMHIPAFFVLVFVSSNAGGFLDRYMYVFNYIITTHKKKYKKPLSAATGCEASFNQLFTQDFFSMASMWQRTGTLHTLSVDCCQRQQGK